MPLTNIGNKVASYRQTNGLTLSCMAQETGLSTALISQIERDLANPTLTVLKTLAKTLGISLLELLEDEVDEESLVLRVEEREKVFNSEDKHVFYNLLTPQPMQSNVSLTLVNIQPHQSTLNGNYYKHKDDEIAFVLTGTVTVNYENASIELYSGDTLRIPANKQHKYYNGTDEAVELLTIKANRNF